MGNPVQILILISTLLFPAIQSIERAFLQNNPKLLIPHFRPNSYIRISLPEPLSFSDQVSNEQAYFLFKRIFYSYTTFEFYAMQQERGLGEDSPVIIKRRWSFKDRKNNNQYVFYIYFFLDHMSAPEKSWAITEIKAEKL